MQEKNTKIQSKADIMEQLSRSLQTERNSIKQELKVLEDKINPPKVEVESTDSTETTESQVESVKEEGATAPEVKPEIAE